MLVRSILKHRPFLALQDKPSEDCDFLWTSWKRQSILDWLPTHDEEEERPKLYGRMEDNFHLSNKKALFLNISNYYKVRGTDPFKARILPLTFHIKNGRQDPQFKMLEQFV